MSNPGLTKDEAERRISLVESKLKAGFAPKGGRLVKGQRGAVATAAIEDGATPGGSTNWLNPAVLVAGREPDWSLYVAPEVPDGHFLKGQSVLKDGDGNVKLVWEKTAVDADRYKELLEATVEEYRTKIKPVKRRPKVKGERDDFLNCYILTDYHLGMLAWPEETGPGEDWNLHIAESTLIKWFAAAIDQSPKAEKAILAQLGDFLHWDGLDAVTPTSGNLLDADTRFQLLARTAIRCVRTIIEMLLDKYPHVHVLMAEGNHDLASSVWLREFLSDEYRNEPRVVVDASPDPYYCYEHGQVSLFFHHGHKKKLNSISDVFVGKFREVFGRTKFSYAHMGHFHHIETKENNLMVVEQHRTLASKDAYASGHGYLAGRSASVITYHMNHGEIGRITLTPEMVS